MLVLKTQRETQSADERSAASDTTASIKGQIYSKSHVNRTQSRPISHEQTLNWYSRRLYLLCASSERRYRAEKLSPGSEIQSRTESKMALRPNFHCCCCYFGHSWRHFPPRRAHRTHDLRQITPVCVCVSNASCTNTDNQCKAAHVFSSALRTEILTNSLLVCVCVCVADAWRQLQRLHTHTHCKTSNPRLMLASRKFF